MIISKNNLILLNMNLSWWYKIIKKFEKNIKNWLRYLYVNESGVAEEIEERIQNLKIAAELEDENFDEDEFRRYMRKENMEDDDDDLQVEL